MGDVQIILSSGLGKERGAAKEASVKAFFLKKQTNKNHTQDNFPCDH